MNNSDLLEIHTEEIAVRYWLETGTVGTKYAPPIFISYMKNGKLEELIRMYDRAVADSTDGPLKSPIEFEFDYDKTIKEQSEKLTKLERKYRISLICLMKEQCKKLVKLEKKIRSI
jgi:hypothetical protein